jgi:Sec-independent protein translocase protein TatA
MKHFYALLVLFFIFPSLSPAQYSAKSINVSTVLTSGEVPVLPSSQKWEKRQDLVNGHISKSKLTRMKNVTDALVSFLHDSCIFEGGYNPLIQSAYFPENTGSGPLMKFGVQFNFDDKKARLTIMANDISPLLGHLSVNNQDFFTITIPTTIKSDCPYYEYSAGADDTEERSSLTKTWLVTTGNHQLPYTVVTRGEYLREARTELTGIRNGIIADIKQKAPVRSLAEQEAEKKATIDQLNATYSGIDLQIRMKQFLKNYKTDEEYLKATTEQATADLDSTLHLMDSLLTHCPASELNKPAAVSAAAADFRGFENDHSDKMLIRINQAYFNQLAGAETPQFFLVSWQYDPSATMAADIDRQLKERLDVEKLKALLGK